MTSKKTSSDAAPPTARPAAPDRIALAFLAAVGAVVGAWALVAPVSFYTGFPGLGRSWVSPDGPYNEHLVRDVGALYLALGVVAAAGFLRPDRRTAILAGSAWLVFSVPHLAYHAGHLAPFGTGDAIAQLVSLSVVTLVAAGLLRPRRADRGTRRGTRRATLQGTGGAR
jgi:hypothetical protein